MRTAVLAVLGSIAMIGTAHAGGVALEVYTGDRPADASRLLSPVLDELAARGFSTGDTVARSYESKVSREAQTATGLPRDFAAQVDAGFKAWVAGRFDDAIKTLTPLVELAHANTGVVAKDQTLREPLLKAMTALAISQQRTGDPGSAKSTFAEMLRGYPEAQVTRAKYGGDAADLFDQAQRELAAAGRGKLTVEVADEGGVVFVDELYRAVGTTTLELPPGEYRVCVVREKRPSRSHRVLVRANDQVKLSVDGTLDSSVHTSGWVGLAFASEAEREGHEAPYAAAVANSLAATAVAIVGIDQVRGRPAVVGALVSLQTGREIRRASVAMEPDPSTERLKALARYLAGDEPAAGLDVQTPGTASASTGGGVASGDVHGRDDGAPREAGSRWGAWKWVAGGAAVASLGVGGYLAAIDGSCQDTPQPGKQCANVYATSPVDYGVLAAGAALAGLSIYMFATDHPSAPARSAYIVPARGGAFAGVNVRF